MQLPSLTKPDPSKLPLAGGTLTGDLIMSSGARMLLEDGSDGSPAMAFSSETSSGIYLSSPGTWGFVSLGTPVLFLSSSKVEAQKPFQSFNGSISEPIYSFSLSTNSGIYRTSFGNSIGFVSNGIELFRLISSTSRTKFLTSTWLADDITALYGSAGDASIFYDNTNLVIDPKLIGSGFLKILGSLALDNGEESRYYDVGNSNYVGFKAPALTANQIWTLPTIDGNSGDVMQTDGAGVLSWNENASEKAWTFSSPAGASGTNYYGGFYNFGATDNDFNPSITHGTANSSYAAHVFLVQAAGAGGGTDTVIRVTGTSITDAGVRTAADTEDLTVDDVGVVNTYYETIKKWIGQVTIAKQSGPDLLCNYGFCKYWDNSNTDFRIEGVDATWLAGANDANPDLRVIHHKATGWTYNAGAAATPPSDIASMNADHGVESELVNGEEGAWKKTGINHNIMGSTTEGIIIEAVTTANKAFELGDILIRITPQ